MLPNNTTASYLYSNERKCDEKLVEIYEDPFFPSSFSHDLKNAFEKNDALKKNLFESRALSKTLKGDLNPQR